MTIVKPPRLVSGDVIGIISPSSPVASSTPRRLRRGIANLEAIGFRARLGKHVTARARHTAGTIEQRVEDVHSMYSDPQVKAIISCIGGKNSNQLLDMLDYDLVRGHPKVIMGYSDVTAILLAVHTMTQQVTFLGPAILPQFGEYDGLHPFTRRSMELAIMDDSPIGLLEPSREWIVEVLQWDIKDTRPRHRQRHPGPRIVREGEGTGPIIAGNLGTLLALVGTKFLRSFEGCILCVEESEDKTLAIVDRFLTQLRLMGVYEEISGLILGRLPPNVASPGDNALEEILLTATRGYSFPVVMDFDIGHTDPMVVLPIGVQAMVSAIKDVEFRIDESAVE